MIFDLGSILTLAIVLIILAVYRQFDKHNRHLDTVKKFTEQVRGDLEAFVRQRTLEIKDFVVELQVHQDTGKEILKRIQELESHLDDRAGFMTAMEEKLRSYGTSIQGLHDLSGRVEENLQRLKAESEFVDKVGRRMKAAQEQMAELEKGIPALREEFRKQGGQALESLKKTYQETWNKDSQKMLELVHGAHERVENFETFVKSLDARKGAFLQEAGKLLEESLQDGLKRAEESLEQHLEQAESHREGLRQDLDAQHQNILLAMEDTRPWRANEKTPGSGAEG